MLGHLSQGEDDHPGQLDVDEGDGGRLEAHHHLALALALHLHLPQLLAELVPGRLNTWLGILHLTAFVGTDLQRDILRENHSRGAVGFRPFLEQFKQQYFLKLAHLVKRVRDSSSD